MRTSMSMFNKPNDITKIEQDFELLAGYVRVGNLQALQQALDMFKNRPEYLGLLLNMESPLDKNGQTLIKIAAAAGHSQPENYADILHLLINKGAKYDEEAIKEVFDILKSNEFAVPLDPQKLEKEQELLFASLGSNVEDIKNTRQLRNR